jgi:protein-S-isoprenylcysteine O-methyltransferase Ste14
MPSAGVLDGRYMLPLIHMMERAVQEPAEVAIRRRRAAIGSALFMAVGPGTVAGLVPFVLTRWRAQRPLPGGVPAGAAGAVLVGVGGTVITSAFVRFVREGLGTPMPMAPPSDLVVGGVYRYVRNPMYLALASTVLGQALMLGSRRLLLYVTVMALPVYAFVRFHEEPVLERTFRQPYERYCANVPRWLPRLHPWDGA